jgi:S1-C subfamily serine protease
MPVKSQDELVRKVGDVPAGSTVDIDLVRGGKQVSLKVRIDLRDKSVAGNYKDIFPGMSVISLASDRVDQKNLPAGSSGGVLVTDVLAKSPASVMGLKPGDIVVAVNDKKVDGMASFFSLINDPKNKKLSYKVIRDEQTIDTLVFNKN